MPARAAVSAAPETVGIRKQPGRVAALDGVRGLAILLVMFHHFTVINPTGAVQSYIVRVAAFGPQGVDLFFVLSGFLITSILVESKTCPSFFKNFYTRRTLRIFPLYYAVVILSLLLLPWLLSLSPRFASKFARMGSASQDLWWYLTYTSNFLVAWTNNWRHGVLGVTWSLAIEEQYYLVWAVVVYFTSARTLRRLCLAMICAAPLLRIALYLSGYTWMQIYVLTPCRFDALAWGSLVAVIYQQGAEVRERFAALFYRALVLIGPALAICIAAGLWEYDHPPEFTLGYSLVDLCFASLLAAVVWGKRLGWARRIFEGHTLTFFGKYSYALYLFHLPIRAAIRDLWFSRMLTTGSAVSMVSWQLVFYMLATLACVPAVLASWHWYEKYFLKLKERFA